MKKFSIFYGNRKFMTGFAMWNTILRKITPVHTKQLVQQEILVIIKWDKDIRERDD
jgi:hypothetical protein